jgi:hypothetical protein
MIVFWAMASAPLLADLLKTLRISPARTNHLVTARRSYVLAVVCGGLLALASPWVRPELSFLPESRRSLLDPQLPIAGVARLKQVLGAGRIYNYREWAGVLALEGSAHWRVRIDGRIYRYPLDEWHQYNQVAGAAVDHRTILMADHPAALFLRPDHDRALIQSLQTNPEWIDLYEDPQCHIFISRLNALVAAAHEESAERLHETSHPAPW